MQMKDWIVIFIIVVIVAVLLDGVRRKLAGRNRVVLKIDRSLPPVDADDELLSPELPNGGARTIVRDHVPPPPTLRGPKTATLRNRAVPGSAAAQMQQTRSTAPEPRDRAAIVPVLMDAVDIEEEHITHASVLADTSADETYAADHFEEEAGGAAQESGYSNDEEQEEDAGMLREAALERRHQVYSDARNQGRDDEDEYEGEVEEYEDEDDLEEEDDFEEELDLPGGFEEEEFDEEEDEEFEDDEFEDDEEEEDEDEDEDLDELEGIPEDDWGSDEEQDLLVDDYESEPVLLQDTYRKAANHFSRPGHQQRIEPGFGEDNAFDEDELNEDFGAAQADPDDMAGMQETAEALRPAPVSGRQAPPSREVPKTRQVDLFQSGDATRHKAPEARAIREPRPPRSHPFQPAPEMTAPPETVIPGPQEVIIINVMARHGQQLAGAQLLPVLQQHGLRLGEMSIFHRHAETNGAGPVMFSMANMVKPGTFDLAAMQEFSTPGVSFFVQLPNPLGNMQAFDKMLSAATAVRNALDGELKDENRSVFTRQTVEHCRQRIRDFELKLQLLARKH